MSIELIQTLSGHEDSVWGVQWRPNYPSQLASCGGKRILLWDLNAPEPKLKAVLFNKNPSVKNFLKKDRIEIPEPVNSSVHSKTVRNLNWSHDGECLGVASFDATVSLWMENESNEWVCSAVLEGQENEVKQLSWAPDNKHIATCSRNKSIWLHSFHDDRFICSAILTGHLQDVKYVVWHSKEKLIFSCSYDNTIRMWAPLQNSSDETEEEWSCVDTLTKHTATVWQMSFAPSGIEFASCSEDRTVCIWTAVPQNKVTLNMLMNSKVNIIPSQFILQPSRCVLLFHLLKSAPIVNSNWICSAQISGFHKRSIFAVAWHPTLDIIATACGDNSVKIFKRTLKNDVHRRLDGEEIQDTWELLCELPDAHAEDVNTVSWNKNQCDDGTWLLATGSDDGEIHIYKFFTGKIGLIYEEEQIASNKHINIECKLNIADIFIVPESVTEFACRLVFSGVLSVTMSKHRNAYLDTALHILKGAICSVTSLTTARSTKTVKFQAPNVAKLVVGPFQEPLSKETIDEIQAAVDAKISECSTIRLLVVPRDLAEKIYGESLYDEFGILSNITELQIAYLPDWNINCNANPILKNTGLLNFVRITEVTHNEKKSTVEFLITSKKLEDYSVDKDSLAKPEYINNVEDLPLFPDIDEQNCEHQTITPWEVKTTKNIDYNKLLKQFGCSRITPDLISRIEMLTNRKAHYFLRRGIFFSHRDLEFILDAYEQNIPFYIYTGRGPSSESLHIGHLIPLIFTKVFQEIFDVPVMIQLTDDEKFLFKNNLSLEDTHRLAYENAKDIISIGFDVKKTFIFSDLDYIKFMYPVVLKIQDKMSMNQARGAFGFTESDSVGKFAFPAIQAAPSFAAAFPNFFPNNYNKVRCLIPQAVDQDPYFRLTRQIAPRLGYMKPALIHSKFIPALQGFNLKMSGSSEDTCIYVTDSPSAIKKKIQKFAFSGGQATIEEHREKGANLDVDVSYEYLKFFLDDDEQLKEIETKYKSGEMLSGKVKSILIKCLQDIVAEHQLRRSQVTDELLMEFMNPNKTLVYKNSNL